jgi:hypothetical protein
MADNAQELCLRLKNGGACTLRIVSEADLFGFSAEPNCCHSNVARWVAGHPGHMSGAG